MNGKKDRRKAEEMEDILEELEKESAEGKKECQHHKDDDTAGNVKNAASGCSGEEIEKDSSGTQKKDNKEEAADRDTEKKKDDEKKADQKDPRQEKIDELNDKVIRQMAEFDNYRKRTEKEKDSMFDAGARSVIEKILPIVDNFERGITAVSDEDKDSAFVKGVQMIYKQLSDELDKMGVKPIEAVGKPFDPNFHNAVMQVSDDKLEVGTVAQELQKGYTYNDVVIRHSMVAVVQ